VNNKDTQVTFALFAIVARVESRRRHHGNLRPASLPVDQE